MTLEMQKPRPVYFLLISILTQLVLAIAAFAVLLPAGLLRQLPWSVVGFLFAYNIAIATLMALMLTGNSLDNKHAVIKGDGLVLGHFVGLLLGGFAGMKFGGLAWAIGGAALLYFVFGWVGARISVTVAARLDREAAPRSQLDLQTALRRASRPSTSSLFLYGAVIPGLLMAAAVLLRSSGLPFAQYAYVLPTARTVLVVLSLISIALPWLPRRRVAPRRGDFSRSSMLWLTGLGLSLAPAFYGFLLFVAFDMSLAELGLFAVVASMAATAYGVSRPR
jgi:hypothetical protein